MDYRRIGHPPPSLWRMTSPGVFKLQKFWDRISTANFICHMKNFCAKRQTQNKKSYSRILFFGFESRLDQESRWFNRRNFWKKVDQTLYKINTYHSPHVNYAWKRPQKLLCGPPWPSFFIDFRNLSSDLTRCDRKKTWTRVPTVLKDPGFGIIRPS